MENTEILPKSFGRWFTLGEKQVQELEEYASLARAHLTCNEEGHRVQKDYISEQLELVRSGIRGHRLSDITCWWLTQQEKYKV